MTLEDGSFGRAAVPSGASTGAHEAVELRDGEPDALRRQGRDRSAVDAVNGEIFDALSGFDAEDQRRIDAAPHRARRHGEQEPARRQRHPRRVAGDRQGGRQSRPSCRSTSTSAASAPAVLPVPQMNIINGGVHADNPIDIQEFMILPTGAPTFADALRMGSEIFHSLKSALHAAGQTTNVGDEGGFAPNLKSRRRGAGLHRQGRARRPATSRARTSTSASTPPPASSSRTASTS